MTSFKEAIGRRVLGREDAESIGKLSGFVVDPGRRKVMALVVGSGRKAAVYRWAEVSGFGPDAVLVQGAPAEGDEAKELSSGRGDPLGKRLLTVLGEEIGKVADLEFDPDTAELRSLKADTGVDLRAELLQGVGSYAVVVDTPS